MSTSSKAGLVWLGLAVVVLRVPHVCVCVCVCVCARARRPATAVLCGGCCRHGLDRLR